MLGLDASAWNADEFAAKACIARSLNADWNLASDEESASKPFAFAASDWKKAASLLSAFIAFASAARASNPFASVAMTLFDVAFAAALWNAAGFPPNLANACAF